MAIRHHSTFSPGLDPATLMLARLFPRWRGDTSEPAIPPPPSRPKTPTPAAAAALELA
jgi:hypothetical protein